MCVINEFKPVNAQCACSSFLTVNVLCTVQFISDLRQLLTSGRRSLNVALLK